MEIFHRRVAEAQSILAALELPAPLRSKLAALTLLALAGIGPDTPWALAGNPRKGMSRGIRDFIRTAYAWPEASTEHTFLLIRNQVLLPLVGTGLVLRNPDNPALASTSPRLHFALTPELLPVLRLYGTPQWPAAVTAFQQAREPVLPVPAG
jgi:type II restriction enzyme